MPRQRRFFSYCPQPPQNQHSHSGVVAADEETPVNACLFSTFAVYQQQNQQTRPRVSAERAIAGPGTAAALSSQRKEEVPELNSAFMRLYARFREKYDFQFPDTPCAYCSQLLLPRNIIWERLKPGYEYPISEKLQLSPTMQIKNGHECIAICKGCKTIPGRIINPGPWPQCLLDLPHRSRMFLSPLTLQTNLGRTQSSRQVHNPYSTYRTITGQMNITRNPRAIALFSGMIGAYLESSQCRANSGHDIQLLNQCRQWLLHHNPLFARHDVRSELDIHPLPSADLFDEEAEARPPNRPDIILNPDPYDPSTQDEDYRYFRLPVASFTDSNRQNVGLLRSDPAIEPLLFPVLYPHGHGHWVRPSKEDRIRGRNTLLQDVQKKLNGAISHFREDHYWPGWAYMEIEAIRILQNNQRIVSARTRQALDRRMPASDLLQQSIYGPWSVINEKLTTSIPHFIRTGSTYFAELEQRTKAMLAAYSIPTLFITLTFSEQWPAYQQFIASTGSRDTLPSNRPWEAVQYYYERLYWIKSQFLRNPNVSGFGILRELIERQEFQLRGAIHSHDLLWTEKAVDKLIEESYIRADIPDRNLEPRLHELVMKFQIHTCREDLCGGAQAPTGQCRKGFPAPLSPTTHLEKGSLRYTYKRTSEADRWVVPYNAKLLLLWEGHCNVQYCTGTGLASYISKYVTKAEPKSLVNLQSSNHTTSHLLARRMGSMECMVLLLSFRIFNMTSGTIYLPTALPTMRTSTVKPAYLLEQDPDNPYYADALDKYFARPDAEGPQSCTYFEYFSKYVICKRKMGNRQGWQDRFGYHIYPRLKVFKTRNL
jgi:hypothetical protein